MNVIMDACSVINLHNGGVLEIACQIDEVQVQVGPIAGGECSEDCAVALATLNDAGSLEYLTDTHLDADTFLEFVDQHRLGEGEAECILLAEIDDDAVVCCDDLRGRKKATALLGEGRLIGSLALLRMAVEGGQLDSQEALAAYQQMRDAGGFLPELGLDYFAA